ncbi:MAG TPA: methyltransferase domain-containing protein [Kiritimatiellia bacterium]|nr:methyltransferase domain-containing protein [Kiritimatiellia bacterium]HNS81383.1 methyltransferase domain-containing protein [Kiritimatiellia bacterium]
MHEAHPLETSGRTLDHAAAVYDVLSPLMTFGLERKYRKAAIQLLELAGSEAVLDVGCGTGTLTLEIASALGRNGRAAGVDAAPKMIAVAEKKSRAAPNVGFSAALAENLPFPDESFDRAVSTFFFHHVNYGLKVRSLNEMHRVLKPAGAAVIVDVDVPSNLWGRICAWSGFVLFQQDEIRENIRGRLREALAASAFDRWEQVSHHSGYISIFKLWKQ